MCSHDAFQSVVCLQDLTLKQLVVPLYVTVCLNDLLQGHQLTVNMT